MAKLIILNYEMSRLEFGNYDIDRCISICLCEGRYAYPLEMTSIKVEWIAVFDDEMQVIQAEKKMHRKGGKKYGKVLTIVNDFKPEDEETMRFLDEPYQPSTVNNIKDEICQAYLKPSETTIPSM